MLWPALRHGGTADFVKIRFITIAGHADNLPGSRLNNLRYCTLDYRSWSQGDLVPGAKGARRRAMRAKLSAFLTDESGATAIEYALIAAGIAIAIIGAVNGVGSALNGKFGDISKAVSTGKAP